MIFFAWGSAAVGLLIGAGILVAYASNNLLVLSIIEKTSAKLIGYLLISINISSLFLGIVSYIFVPRAKVIYFNLLFVFVTLLISLIGVEGFGSLYYRDSERIFSTSNANDITGVVLILVLASAGCVYKIERIQRKEGE